MKTLSKNMDESHAASLENARQEIEDLLLKKESEPAHTRHVAHLALQIFDQLVYRHGLGARERIALEFAALLHDTGWSESPDGGQHHKYSFWIILRTPWKKISEKDILLIALTARYHRKSLPRKDHEGFSLLDHGEQKVVWILGGILRLADALDRQHLQGIRSVAIQDDSARLCLSSPFDEIGQQEILALEKKKNMFEKAFGLPLFILNPVLHLPRK